MHCTLVCVCVWSISTPFATFILSNSSWLLFVYFSSDISRWGQPDTGQLHLNWKSHLFLQFPDDLADCNSFISLLIALLSKKIGVPQALSLSVVDESNFTARLDPFLTLSSGMIAVLSFLPAMDGGGSLGFGRWFTRSYSRSSFRQWGRLIDWSFLSA